MTGQILAPGFQLSNPTPIGQTSNMVDPRMPVATVSQRQGKILRESLNVIG